MTAGADIHSRHLAEVRHLARLLDNAVRIPIINYRVGLDPILGLAPVVGDIAGFGLSAYIIFRAYQMGAPVPLLLVMAANVVIDTVVGSVPVLGSVFDFVWKANARNLRLLERFLSGGGTGRPALR